MMLKNCLNCESAYIPNKFHHTRQKYCSLKCQHQVHDKIYRDKYRYNGLRELIISRDKGKCITCGMTKQEHKEKWGKDLTINHKDGTGFYTPKLLKNNNMDNLETLCLSCHNKKDKAYLNLKAFHWGG